MANLRVDKITSTETFEKTGSVQFDGSGDYLDVTESNNGFDFDGDFTIETWIHINTIPSNSWIDFLGSANNTAYLGSSKSGWIAAYYTLNVTGLQFRLSYQSNSGWIFELGWDYTPDTGNWYHVAYTRKDSVIDCYVNGVKLEKSSRSGTGGEEVTVTSSEGFVRIGGGHGSTAKLLDGHLSNTRILKGKAIYTKNFKPPMRELEVTPETTLLCCQSKTDTILEKTGKTITANGNAVASELTPGILTPIVKSGGGSAITGSVEFDGSGGTVGGYLEIPKASFQFLHKLTDSWTVECWVYKGKSDQGTIFDTGGSSSTTIGTAVYINSDNTLRLRVRQALSATVVSENYTIADPVHEWNHFALSFDGSKFRIFWNGVLLGEVSYSTESATDSTQEFKIGVYKSASGFSGYWNGYISNFRICKGHAVYTDDFIPPTRKLKNVPGTVLLCCQDPNNPLTEVTGKTITPYESLGDGSIGPELVTRDGVWTLTKGGSGATDWTVSDQGRSLAGTTVSGGYIRATYTLSKGDYLVSLRWTGGAFAVQDSTGYIFATDGTDTEFSASEDGAYSFYMSDTTSVVITGTSWSTAYTVDDISIKRIYKNNGASNFTPQVGDDRKVTFEGVTKINTDAYFYLPTGDTVTRDSRSGRGLIMGGYDGSAINSIEFITISSSGNSQDFGDLTSARFGGGSCGSSTRGLFGGGEPSKTPNDYVTIASTGNSVSFGSLDSGAGYVKACSNQTRGIWGGGRNPNTSSINVVQYVTIATLGNSQDFGILTSARTGLAAFSSPTRGIFSGGYTHPSPTTIATLDYITIAATGNALDFGDLLTNVKYGDAVSSGTRGIIGGGGAGANTNVMQYVTISTLGDAVNFGDLITAREHLSGTDNSIRGVFIGGVTPTILNIIDYMTIASTGDAADFGDLSQTIGYPGSTSDSHGGLG